MSVRDWPKTQARGFVENLERVFTDTSRDECVPPTYGWFLAHVGRSFGIGTPQEQFVSSTVMVTISAVLTVVTGGAAILLIFLFLLTLGIGFLRMVPAVDAVWPGGGGF